MHLYKLSTQQFLSYELRNGNMMLTLTEKGFLWVKEGAPGSAAQPAAQQGTTDAAASPQPEAANSLLNNPDIQKYSPPKTDDELKALETKILNQKRIDKLIIAVIVIVMAVVVFYLYVVGII